MTALRMSATNTKAYSKMRKIDTRAKTQLDPSSHRNKSRAAECGWYWHHRSQHVSHKEVYRLLCIRLVVEDHRPWIVD